MDRHSYFFENIKFDKILHKQAFNAVRDLFPLKKS